MRKTLDCRTPETVLANARKADVDIRQMALGYPYSPVLSAEHCAIVGQPDQHKPLFRLRFARSITGLLPHLGTFALSLSAHALHF